MYLHTYCIYIQVFSSASHGRGFSYRAFPQLHKVLNDNHIVKSPAINSRGAWSGAALISSLGIRILLYKMESGSEPSGGGLYWRGSGEILRGGLGLWLTMNLDEQSSIFTLQ